MKKYCSPVLTSTAFWVAAIALLYRLATAGHEERVDPQDYDLMHYQPKKRAWDAHPPYKEGDSIMLPNGKRATVTKVLPAENLFGEPEHHVSTATGEEIVVFTLAAPPLVRETKKA